MKAKDIKKLREEFGYSLFEARDILEEKELLKEIDEGDVVDLKRVLSRIVKKIYGR